VLDLCLSLFHVKVVCNSCGVRNIYEKLVTCNKSFVVLDVPDTCMLSSEAEKSF